MVFHHWKSWAHSNNVGQAVVHQSCTWPLDFLNAVIFYWRNRYLACLKHHLLASCPTNAISGALLTKSILASLHAVLYVFQIKAEGDILSLWYWLSILFTHRLLWAPLLRRDGDLLIMRSIPNLLKVIYYSFTGREKQPGPKMRSICTQTTFKPGR